MRSIEASPFGKQTVDGSRDPSIERYSSSKVSAGRAPTSTLDPWLPTPRRIVVRRFLYPQKSHSTRGSTSRWTIDRIVR